MKQKYNELPIHVKRKHTQYEPEKELISMDTTIRSQRHPRWGTQCPGGGVPSLALPLTSWVTVADPFPL